MSLSLGVAPRFLDVMGVRTAWFGDLGPRPVVLLHGAAPGACTEVNWCLTFDALRRRGHHVLAYDQPGFGRSSLPSDHSVEFRFAHLVGFLRALGVREASLVGNSVGGLLSVLLNLRYADHGIETNRLVLIAPLPHIPLTEATRKRHDVHRQRLGSLEPTLESVRSLCSNTFHDLTRAPAELVALRHAMMGNERWSGVLGRRAAGNGFDGGPHADEIIMTPTLMIWGLQDRSVPPQAGLELMPRFRNGEFVFLDRCGHWPQIECADEVHSLIDGFLARPDA
jgi:2-hydroxy-6-oxonona-2,4-dienedioate hydrolase